MEEDESRAARPNSVFLARVLQGNQRGNQREIDTNASRAAQKAVGASGAASIRPSLTRSAKKGPEAIRRTALSAAQEQKLILCTSLLKEVARLYGFRLSVCHGFSTSSPPGAEGVGPGGAAAAPASGGEHMDVQANGTAGGPGATDHHQQQQQQQQQQEGGTQEGRANQDELQDLQVSLKLPAISVGTWADDGEEDEDEGEEGEEEEGWRSAKGKLRHAAAPTPRGSAVLSGLRARAHTPQQVQKRVRPKLASNALSSLGLALRKAAAPPSSAVREAKQRRASSVKANDGAEEEKEDGAAMQQPTPDPCSIAPSVSNAPKFLDTASPSAPSQAPAPAVPAPMEESSPAPEGNAQMHLPELPPALMQSKASTSLPPQKAPGPAAASLQPPSQLDQQDHAGVEGMGGDGAGEKEEEGETGTPTARSSKKRRGSRGGKGSGRGSAATGTGDLSAGVGGQSPTPATTLSMPPAEGQPAASNTPAATAAAAAAAPSGKAMPAPAPPAAATAATPLAGPASQQQAQPSVKRTPAQGLFGAAMRDLKKVKPGGAGKAGSAGLGAGERKEEGQE